MKLKANLFIVGVAKAATSSLYSYLSDHPDIYMSRVKEPHFFAQDHVELCSKSTLIDGADYIHRKMIKNLDEYNSLFDCDEDVIYRGESSPSYLWAPGTASNIYSYNPSSKIIIILRDPIQRAYSHFLMDLKAGAQKNTSFYKALIRDEKVEPKLWGKAHLYKELGFYYDSVIEFIEVFGKENVHIVLFDELKNKSANVLEQTLRFLNVNSDVEELNINTDKIHNQSDGITNPIVYQIRNFLQNRLITNKIPTNKRLLNKIKRKIKNRSSEYKIEKKAVDYLCKIYKPDLVLLQKYLNQDLSSLFSSCNAE